MSNDTSMGQIIAAVRDLEGVLVLEPRPGDGTPEIAWGDAFFYYAPDGQVPTTGQPYGTVVTKNYPDDVGCDLDRPDRWRVNVHVGRDRLSELVQGRAPEGAVVLDAFLPHPLYGDLGWVCVVNPGASTTGAVLDLLREAHDAARGRAERRRSLG
ncbi:DUF6194 family protein [Krasilnikoviella flava]|uniref:DUF6194 domain-containing protein n=1 Tax=Krasilnikoviella flava TaxID=526729 RepID=A0A1T5INR9_9MICO|nr:DUF6194 family protein [Krasilnikoviella flava]SKC40807.1 hypothetical protein SAMN04324258_0749 [Krasilnikoviella flava]